MLDGLNYNNPVVITPATGEPASVTSEPAKVITSASLEERIALLEAENAKLKANPTVIEKIITPEDMLARQQA